MPPDLHASSRQMNARRAPFDSVTISFHWATVLIVLALFASAWLHSQSHNDVFRATLLEIHRSLGLTIWLATALRLIWRTTNARLPPFPTDMTKIHRNIVRVSEYGLYALLLCQPASGLGATLFRGHEFIVFAWRIPQLIAKNPALEAAFYLVHELGAWALGILIAGHATAALFGLSGDNLVDWAAAKVPFLQNREKFTPPG